jgi:hypothetical protein
VFVTDDLNDTLQGALRDKVQRWLAEEGWSLVDATEPQAVWGLGATDALGRAVGVGQLRGHVDQVQITAVTQVIGEVQAKLHGMPAAERDRFLWDLKMELLRCGHDFLGVEIPMKMIVIRDMCYFDGLTKDTFFSKLDKVRRGIILVQLMMQAKLTQDWLTH